MRRVDPFFAGQRPHKNGYLESLHRTYGEPVSALPTRGDVLFERAYQFRQKEKAKYASIEREAEQARHASDELSSKYKQLQEELDQIRPLFEQLSKLRYNNDPGNGEHANGDASDRGGGNTVQPAEDSEDASKGVGGDVPVEVLRHDGDVHRRTKEHAAQGSKPGSGPTEAADASGASERETAAGE